MERIKDFKEENPEYKFIRINFEGEKYEYPDYKNHMGYVVYFYFPDKNITIACVIKQGPDNPARLGFNSYSTGTNGGGWLNINKDIKKSESKELKKKFETEILNKIGGWSKK